MKKLWLSGFNLSAYMGDARLKVTIVAAMTLFTLVPLFTAMAQEDDSFLLEEITVTGSRIRGVEGVGTSVVGIDRKDMEISAGVTVDAIIKELPSVMDIGITEVTRAGSGGQKNAEYSSSINIHGIGSYSTLTLLDGHRVVSNNRVGVNPGMLPSMGLERIEVVADGASAIYGSDAVAGVVNLIPRRTLDGVDTRFRYGSAADTDQWQAGGAVGKMWDSGQFMVAYEHTYRGSLSDDDRDFATADQRPWGGPDYRTNKSSPGNIIVGPTSYAIPEGGVTPATANLLVAGTENLYEIYAGRNMLPEQEADNANFTFNQQINKIEFFADGFYSRRDYLGAGGHTSNTYTVPSTNAFFVQPPGMTVNSYKVAFNFADIPGVTPSVTDGYSKNWEITPGFRYDLPHGFQLEALYTYGQGNEFRYSTSPTDSAALAAALASSNPATALDLWGGGRTTPETIAALESAFSRRAWENDFRGYEVSVNGPVLDLPGGALSLAAGYEGQKYAIRSGRHDGHYPEPLNLTWLDDMTRDVDSVYIEFYIPIFGQKNATTGINRLELTAAIRYDDYSDVGSTTNPKIGFNYSPIEPLMFHGSYGTSFRAPVIDDIGLEAYGVWTLWGQPYQNPAGGAPVMGYTLFGVNPDLKPEEATNWSLGAAYDLTEDTKIKLDFFSVEYDKQINTLVSNTSILGIEDEFAGTDVIRRGQEASDFAVYMATTFGADPGRSGWPNNDPANVDLVIDGRPRNLGSSLTQGIDFQVSHNLRTDTAGSFRFTLDGTYFMKYEIAYTSDGPKRDALNEINNPLQFKARGAVTWNYEPFTSQVAFRYVNGYDNTAITPTQKVDSWMPVDIVVSFNGDDVDWLGSFGTGLSVSLEARNAFDTDPPYVNYAPNRSGGGGWDPSAADPNGRLLAISLRKTF